MQEPITAGIELARSLVQQGRLAEAEAALHELLAGAPDLVEALSLLGQLRLNRGDAAEAQAVLDRVTRLSPDDVSAWKGLGLAERALGRFDAARAAFERALAQDGRFFLARLHLAQTLEALGQPALAASHYFGAVNEAQSRGRWRNDASTPPPLRAAVQHAIGHIDHFRPRIFEAVLEPYFQKFGRSELRRVEDCLAIYLGEKSNGIADPKQRPVFLYFPGLPSPRYFARELFDWIAALEAQAAIMRDELAAVMAEDAGFEPFLRFQNEAQRDEVLGGLHGPPQWNAFFFHRHGVRNDENFRRCPRSAAIIEGLPLCRIRQHAPEVCFSVLTPGSHILLHTGVTNTRVVAHLPLVVPEDCALVVGGEAHVWQEGRVVVFDDTFEHEAWNHSRRTRVVMLIDIWNPHLTAPERDAVTALIGAIGDFNRAGGMAD